MKVNIHPSERDKFRLVGKQGEELRDSIKAKKKISWT
jgi:hypothetical protein